MHAANFLWHYTDAEADEELRHAGYTGPGWYFFDETEAYILGPFGTKSLCRMQRDVYFNLLNPRNE